MFDFYDCNHEFMYIIFSIIFDLTFLSREIPRKHVLKLGESLSLFRNVPAILYNFPLNHSYEYIKHMLKLFDVFYCKI